MGGRVGQPIPQRTLHLDQNPHREGRDCNAGCGGSCIYEETANGYNKAGKQSRLRQNKPETMAPVGVLPERLEPWGEKTPGGCAEAGLSVVRTRESFDQKASETYQTVRLSLPNQRCRTSGIRTD